MEYVYLLLLDNVQLFRLFTFPFSFPFLTVLWVPLACIYIPKSNVYSLQFFNNNNQGFSLFLSLFTWYQSLGRKKNPNYFRFIRESILGNLLVTVFHSGHPSHLLKLSINPHRRWKTLTAGDFSGDFRRIPFPTLTIPPGAQGGDLQLFSKHRRENPGHVCLFSGGLNLTRRRLRHFPATRFHLQPHLTPSSHPPFALVSSEP